MLDHLVGDPVLDIRLFGAVGDGVTDDSQAFTNAIAAAGSLGRGATLLLPPAVYHVPNGVTESLSGLTVIGLGRTYLTPGTTGLVGAVIKATSPGAWCWTHKSVDVAQAYKGPRFADVTFLGDSDTAGGLKSETNLTHVERCVAAGHTTGTGFQIGPTGAVADASWHDFRSCIAQDCLTGFDIGVGGSAGGELYGCITLKTTSGGIKGTGYGRRIRSSNVTVIGGKDENSEYGCEVTASSAVTVLNARAENCRYGLYLNRAAQTFASRIKAVGFVFAGSQAEDVSVYVGTNQNADEIVACGSAWAMTNLGTNTKVVAS